MSHFLQNSHLQRLIFLQNSQNSHFSKHQIGQSGFQIQRLWQNQLLYPEITKNLMFEKCKYWEK